MSKIHRLPLLLTILFIVVSCNKHDFSTKSDIETEIKDLSDIVTTEVDVEKVLFWDSDKQEYGLDDFNKYKQLFGSQKLIMIVGATLSYGYDMNSIEVIQPDESKKELIIRLPKIAKCTAVIPSDTIDQSKVINLATGLRSKVGVDKIFTAKEKCIETFKLAGDSIYNIIKDDAENNTRMAIDKVMHASRNQGWTYHIYFDI